MFYFASHRSSSRRQGFTLVEMLVVIAITSLLAAILFPVFGRARESARRSSCLSNLKQLGMAIPQYRDDYDGYYPVVVTASPFISWPTLVYPYLKSTQVFVCPDAQISKKVAIDTDLLHGGSNNTEYYFATSDDGSAGSILNIGLSYSMNVIPRGNWSTAGFTAASGKSGFVGRNNSDATETTTPLLESAVEDAVATIHVVDGMSSTNNGGSLRGILEESRTDHFSNADASKVAYRHAIGFNALYGDGHVKWLPYGSTKAGNWTIQSGD